MILFEWGKVFLKRKVEWPFFIAIYIDWKKNGYR